MEEIVPKVIVFFYRGFPKEDAALNTAISLAKKWMAHLDVVHICPDFEYLTWFFVTTSSVPYYLDSSVYKEQLRLQEENKKSAYSRFLTFAEKEGIQKTDDLLSVAGPSIRFQSESEKSHKSLISRARVSDLIVLALLQENGEIVQDELTQLALFDTACPVLVIPPNCPYKKDDNNILITWNESREAARTIKSAFPFMIDKMSHLWVAESDTWDNIDSTYIAEYVKKHGFALEVHTPWIGNSSIPESLMKGAKRLNASLVVMGAYSHSRTREMILGGVTQYMLKHADIPILMAH